jgi:hypothetical protein
MKNVKDSARPSKTVSPTKVVTRKHLDLDNLAVLVRDGIATEAERDQWAEEVNAIIRKVIGDHQFVFVRSTDEDMLQEELSRRTIPNLQKYDITRGSYSAWVYYSSFIFFCRKSANMRRDAGFIKLIEEVAERGGCSSNSESHEDDQMSRVQAIETMDEKVLRSERRNAIRDFMNRHRDEYDFLFAMFGDINKTDWTEDHVVSYTQAIKESCVNRAHAMRFLNNYVRPFMTKLLG